MLHPLEQVRDHQNPLAHPPALASRQAPQLRRPRFAAKKYAGHIWGSPEAGITTPRIWCSRGFSAAMCQQGFSPMPGIDEAVRFFIEDALAMQHALVA
jgi:hypothetical protein